LQNHLGETEKISLDHPATVINMSMNFVVPSFFSIPDCGGEARREFYENLQAEGKKIIVVQAEGNNMFKMTESQGWYTHNCPHVISVLRSAVHVEKISEQDMKSWMTWLEIHSSSSRPPEKNNTCYVATYANFYRHKEANILDFFHNPKSDFEGHHGQFIGTSWATPMVAGLAGILKKNDPTMDVSSFCQKMRDAANKEKFRFYIGKSNDNKHDENGNGISIRANDRNLAVKEGENSYIPFVRFYEILRHVVDLSNKNEDLNLKPSNLPGVKKPKIKIYRKSDLIPPK
jgi:hypothetical protein